MSEFTTTVGTWTDEYATYRFQLEVSLELTPTEHFLSVEHQPLAPEVLRLSMMGETGRKPLKGGPRWLDSSAGQNVDDLRKVTDFAPGWDAVKRDEAVEIWERWHLNDMRAGCAHQTVVWEEDKYGHNVPSLDLTPACPETGYRYGHAWLIEELPDEVIEWCRSLGVEVPVGAPT